MKNNSNEGSPEKFLNEPPAIRPTIPEMSGQGYIEPGEFATRIPKMHEGGIVKRTGPVILQAGELVIPKSKVKGAKQMVESEVKEPIQKHDINPKTGQPFAGPNVQVDRHASVQEPGPNPLTETADDEGVLDGHSQQAAIAPEQIGGRAQREVKTSSVTLGRHVMSADGAEASKHRHDHVVANRKAKDAAFKK